MASLIEAVEHYFSADAHVQELCRQLGLKRTPRELRAIVYLGRSGGAAVPEIAVGTGLDVSTVKGIIRRWLSEQKPLVSYPDGPPRTGRPPDTGNHGGRLRLTAQGLRLYDQMRKPLA